MKKRILLFKGLNFILLMMFLCQPHFSFAQENQQQKSISGKITDANGNTLPGVNIILATTSIGTTSDENGKFTLKIPSDLKNPSLNFTYMGFLNLTLSVNNKTDLNVTLEEENNKLNEVVVIGYGSIKKGNVTGAISSIKKESIETRATNNASEAIQGLVAGVNVQKSGGAAGAAVKIKIRGINTFGNTEPLCIIDGFQGSLSSVNPTNIESIEVLKDGAAAAIYGSVAANGVIIVTTKSGLKQGIKVDFTSFVNSTSTAKRIELLDAEGYKAVHKRMYDEYNKYANTPVSLPAYINAPTTANTNWQDQVFRSGLAQNYGLGVQGREGVVKFALYGNYAKEKGIIIDNNFGQKNASARVSFKKSIFDIDTKLSYLSTKSEQPNFQLKEVYAISPLVPVLDSNETYGYGLTNKNGLPFNTNPVADEHFRSGELRGQDLTANISITANIASWLKFKTAYSHHELNSQRTAHNAPFIANIQAPEKYTVHREVRTYWSEQVFENTLMMDKKFGEHSIDFLLGSTINPSSSNWNDITVEGKTTDQSVVNGQLVSTERPAGFLDSSFETIGAGKGGTYSADGSKYQYNRLSYFSRINYSYKDRYLAQATLRYDGSSKFGKDSRWGAFPSVALGWKIDKEDFYPEDFIISTAKLRASWGRLGNEAALGYYTSSSLILSGNYLNSGYVQGTGSNPWPGSIATALENRNLKWETTDSKNIGIDYTLRNGKISGSINYYRNVTDDLLITKKLAPSAGIDNPILNVGKVSNSGLEFEVNYSEQSNDFKYNVGFNISTLRNKVESLANADQAINGQGLKFDTEHFPTQARVGTPISSFYLYRANGIFQSTAEVNSHELNGNLIQPNAKPGDVRFKDLNNDGLIDENDKEYAGTGLPKVEANITLGASYKGFDFSTLIGSGFGNKLYNGNRYFYESMSSGTNMLASTLNSWTPDNNSNIPRAVLGDPNGNSRESDRFLENGNFVRMRQLQIGYSLPSSLLEAAKIDKLRFYVSAENVFTITKYSGTDPEFSRNNLLDTGVDRFVYPFTRSFIVGVQYVF